MLANFGLLLLACIVLMILYTAVIVHTIRGSKQSFVFKTAGLLLAAWTCMAANFVFVGLRRDSNDKTRYFDAINVTYEVYSVLLSIGYWLVAQKYYQTAFEIPFLLHQQAIPKSWISNRCTNVTIIALNLVIFALKVAIKVLDALDLLQKHIKAK